MKNADNHWKLPSKSRVSPLPPRIKNAVLLRLSRKQRLHKMRNVSLPRGEYHKREYLYEMRDLLAAGRTPQIQTTIRKCEISPGLGENITNANNL